MKDDPLAWLYGHKNTGVDLRNKGYLLRKGDTAAKKDWEQRARDWETDFRDGVTKRVPADAHRVARIDEYPPLSLPLWHAYYEPIYVGLAFTATGLTFPGNNPIWRLAAWVNRAEVIAEDWRIADPRKPKPVPVRTEHAATLEAAIALYKAGDSKYASCARKAVMDKGRGSHNSKDRAVDAVRRELSNLVKAGKVQKPKPR